MKKIVLLLGGKSKDIEEALDVLLLKQKAIKNFVA